MDQEEFSNYIISGLLKQLPQFEEHCIYKPNGVADIEYYSKQLKVILWLTTQD
jgi:hypothetical protein